jgi:hypothetical protein
MSKVIFPTAWNDQGTRKTGLCGVFLSLAAERGFTVGNSLKVPGAYAFEMIKDGKTHRIGMKSAYDRALNTAFEMGKKVDEVWVFTFKWNDDEGDDVDWRPVALQAYRISALDLAAKFKKVETARANSKTPKAYAFIPITRSDAEDEETKWFGVAGGSLDDTAELIFEGPLVFSDRGAARIETASDAQGAGLFGSEPVQGIAELVLQHKQALAKLYGTTVDRVRILVEA